MPPRLLLDGEDLRELMLRVREEAGPDARIVKAERIRSGGFAGFFAKEHYELTVEVPEVRPARRTRPRPVAARSTAVGLDALLEAADAAEAQDGDPVAVGAEVEVPAPSGPAVSTSGDSFATVLDSVRQMVGPVAPAAQDGAAASDGTAGPDGSAALDGSVASDVTGEAVREAATVESVAVDAVSGEGEAAGRTEGEEPDAAGPPADGPEPGGSSAMALLELGVPARLLAGFADPTAPAPLSQLVRRFERPPTVRLDSGVLAVVGDGDLALRTATQMANRAGLHVHEIVLAGDVEPVPGHGRRLQSTAAVARLRARTSPDVLTVVALGVPQDRAGWDEATEMLAALEPDQAWAALDARRKSVELRRWLRAIGVRRPFDAVAAVCAFDAQAPGTVLSLGVPVGWIDGLPATPVVWAAVLSERLADDARWD